MKPIFCLLMLLVGCGGRERLPDVDPSIPIESFGTCARCDEPWAYVRGHTTMYSETMGVFPLCEGCWSDLSPQDRLPYYEDWCDKWDGTHREQIRRAVLDGK